MMLNFVVKDVEKIKGTTIIRHFKLFLQITLLLNLAFSWGKTGHRTTGEVAEHFLTEKTKKEIHPDQKNSNINKEHKYADNKSERGRKYRTSPQTLQTKT